MVVALVVALVLTLFVCRRHGEDVTITRQARRVAIESCCTLLGDSGEHYQLD